MTDYLQDRRDRAAGAWGLGDEIVLVGAGEPVPVPGRGDQTYPFRAHAEYFWLADRERPGCVLAFDPHEGWTDFVPRSTEEERVWTGGGAADEGTPLDGLGPWLEARAGRRRAGLGGAVEGIAPDAELTAELRARLTHARRRKDGVELERMRRAARATADAFEVARHLSRPGVTERQIQIELEAELFRGGAQRTAYETIVGGGPNAAILHSAPSGRALQRGELVLIDAGAELDGYAADVTRTYPVGDRFTGEQRDLYAVVLETQEAAIAKCLAGREYRDLHLEASVDLARGLVDVGLLRGNPQSLVEQDVHALFFPHGLGHLVGLGVHDASGGLAGRRPSERPGLKYLRVDVPLEPGYVVTIEPGIYFIPALLCDPARREEFKAQVDWDRVDRWLDLGGIRIEDDVLVTDAAPEILTAEIEKALPS